MTPQEPGALEPLTSLREAIHEVRAEFEAQRLAAHKRAEKWEKDREWDKESASRAVEYTFEEAIEKIDAALSHPESDTRGLDVERCPHVDIATAGDAESGPTSWSCAQCGVGFGPIRDEWAESDTRTVLFGCAIHGNAPCDDPAPMYADMTPEDVERVRWHDRCDVVLVAPPGSGYRCNTHRTTWVDVAGRCPSAHPESDTRLDTSVLGPSIPPHVDCYPNHGWHAANCPDAHPESDTRGIDQPRTEAWFDAALGPVSIFIDRGRHNVREGYWSVSDLRHLPTPAIDATRDLYCVVPGGLDRLIDEGIEVCDGLRIFSFPRNVTGG